MGKNQDWSPASCFLGSQVIQFALAVRSAIQGVSLKGQRNIYKERLSTEALGAGRQDAGEQLENRVGRIPSASLEKLSSMLEPFLSHVVAHLPPGSHSVLTIIIPCSFCSGVCFTSRVLVLCPCCRLRKRQKWSYCNSCCGGNCMLLLAMALALSKPMLVLAMCCLKVSKSESISQ